MLLIFFVITLKIIATTCDRSFTVVLDTTVSMGDEINVIKASVGQLVNSLNRTDVENYILVSFKDIVVESPFITESARYFANHLNTITTSGGGTDCPESSLAAIESALRASKQESYIFVFTDAYAKDLERFQSIETLCRESHSQVIIFLSGYCLADSSSTGTDDVYYEVSKACSGAFFRFNTTFELRQVFNFMKEVMNTEWTDITPLEKFTNHKEILFTVDTFTTDLLISVSGSNPVLTFLESSSQRPRFVERVLFTRHALAVLLRRPDPGQYSMSIRGQGKVVVTFYEKNYIPFQYGFSTKLPRSLIETSLRPLAGWENYVMISVDTAITLESIEWLNAGESIKQTIFLEEKQQGLYVAEKHFVEPGKTFRLWIIGKDVVTLQKIKGSTKFIFPQVQVKNVTWTRPQSEILDRDGLLDYATELTLACKVTGFPKPNIRWEDGNEILASQEVLLEIPSVHISYVTLPNVTANSTFYCKSENSIGTSSVSIDIFVNRTYSFDVTETPEDTTVKYGEDLVLSCQVIAYPEANIEWHFNNTKVDSYLNPKVIIQQHTLTVKNVSVEDGGIYVCVASNGVESKSFSAKVEISGLETPEIELLETEMILKLGDLVNIDCRVTRGIPTPQLTWQYKPDRSYEYEDVSLLSGVSIDEGTLMISSVDKQHGGIYKCSASNVVGSDLKYITVKIQYAPLIKNDKNETVTVKEEDNIQLACEVDAIPDATVHWEMNQDDVIVSLGENHKIDENHTLQFTAYLNNSGNYHCIAHNDVGRAERTVTVHVVVPPFIKTPASETIHLKLGGHVDLACNVLYGSPAPDIQWKFIAADSSSSVLTRTNSTLHLRNVTRSDEGSYMCIAENHIGKDNIKYSVKVQ